ncbi:hypothetical protein B0O80DRAFT_26792 [Mortierella sp. GBAus27b]|nr:hypothetical protein B0O80DRAFT_26792 [Mortierella sp. GBAus27b]
MPLKGGTWSLILVPCALSPSLRMGSNRFQQVPTSWDTKCSAPRSAIIGQHETATFKSALWLSLLWTYAVMLPFKTGHNKAWSIPQLSCRKWLPCHGSLIHLSHQSANQVADGIMALIHSTDNPGFIMRIAWKLVAAAPVATLTPWSVRSLRRRNFIGM